MRSTAPVGTGRSFLALEFFHRRGKERSSNLGHHTPGPVSYLDEDPVAAREALEQLTARKFGKDQARWQAWWQANRKQ